MRRAYLVLAIVMSLLLWFVLASLLMSWGLATLLVLGMAGLFWLEVTPQLRAWRPQQRNGWQRNALRWTRRPPDSTEWPQHKRPK